MQDFNISFPFLKVDQSRRVVTGVATADNVDQSSEVVDFSASQEAFAKWLGNIREMHQPKAVGKGLDYREVKVPYHGNVYDGIEVEAYISEGAQDTWKKVLDGTLRGFSVGGRVLEREDSLDKSTGRKISKITKYALGELSLVDNPDNPAAMITMVKSAGGGKFEYVLEDASSEDDLEKSFDGDVFYCEDCQLAKMGGDMCPGCGGIMIDVVNHVERINKAVEDEMYKVTNTHKTPPKGYPQDSGQYADPANYKYPIDSEHIHAAISYYNHEGQQSAGGYSDSQWASIGRKIASAASRLLDSNYSLNNGKVTGEKVEKLLNNNNDDTVQSMDLTDAQQDSVMSRLKKYLFGSDEELTAELSTGTPVNVTVNIDGSAFEKQAASPKSTQGDEIVEPEISKAKKTEEPAGNVTDANGSDTDNDDDNEGATDSDSGNPSASGQGPEAADKEKERSGASKSTKSVTKSADGGEDMNDELLKAIGALLDTKLEEVKDEINKSVDEKIETIEKSVGDVTDKVEKVNDAGAFKKSVDEDGSEDEDTLEKRQDDSFWGGIYVPRAVVEHLGYES